MTTTNRHCLNFGDEPGFVVKDCENTGTEPKCDLCAGRDLTALRSELAEAKAALQNERDRVGSCCDDANRYREELEKARAGWRRIRCDALHEAAAIIRGWTSSLKAGRVSPEGSAMETTATRLDGFAERTRDNPPPFTHPFAPHPGPESREQASQRSTNQETPMAKAEKAEAKRPYVVIRNDMAGVICGVLIDQNEHRTELAEARIIWDWAGEGIETVHDVASVGVGPKSHVSRPVAHVSIRGCAGEATIEATAEAEASLRAAVWAK